MDTTRVAITTVFAAVLMGCLLVLTPLFASRTHVVATADTIANTLNGSGPSDGEDALRHVCGYETLLPDLQRAHATDCRNLHDNDRLHAARQLFANQQMHMPSVNVGFYETDEPCKGHLGLYQPTEATAQYVLAVDGGPPESPRWSERLEAFELLVGRPYKRQNLRT